MASRHSPAPTSWASEVPRRGETHRQAARARHRALVTAAEQAGEREVASTCATNLREEQELAAWLWEHLPHLTQQYLQQAATGAKTKR